MSQAPIAGKPMVSILIGRQLDAADTGNGAYLMIFLRTARAAGFGIRLVMAHSRAFSNRPWMILHPAYAPLVDEIAWRWSLRFGNRFLALAPSVWGRFAIRLGKAVFQKLGVRSGPLVKVQSTLGDLLGQAEASQLAAEVDSHPSAIVVAEYSSLAPVLGRLQSPARKAALLHDLFSIRAESFQARGETPDFRSPTLEEEARDVAAADLLVYASLNEMARLQPLLPQAQAAWLRPEVPAYAPGDDPGPARAVFIGTRHAGNTDALRTLVDDIWPLVLAGRPDAELWIAGSAGKDLTATQAATPGVRILGRVEDLSVLGGSKSVGLAPTRIASGVSIKVAEYLRLGMSCIAYRTALEGFGEELDDLVDVVDGPDAFARRLIDLLGDADGRRQRSERGRTQSATRLDNAPVKTALLQLLNGKRPTEPTSSSAAEDHFDASPSETGFLAASSRHS